MAKTTKVKIEIPEDYKIRIIVLNRGYIRVCYCPNPQECVFWIPYICARTIRNWGTTEGLAQLENGPTENTILDTITKEGQFPVSAVIDILEVNEDKWKSYLNI